MNQRRGKGSVSTQTSKLHLNPAHRIDPDPDPIYIKLLSMATSQITVCPDVTSELVVNECTQKRWRISEYARRPPSSQCLHSQSGQLLQWIAQISPVLRSGYITSRGLLYGRQLALYESVQKCSNVIVLLPLNTATLALVPIVTHKPIQFVYFPISTEIFTSLDPKLTYCIL